VCCWPTGIVCGAWAPRALAQPAHTVSLRAHAPFPDSALRALAQRGAPLASTWRSAGRERLPSTPRATPSAHPPPRAQRDGRQAGRCTCQSARGSARRGSAPPAPHRTASAPTRRSRPVLPRHTLRQAAIRSLAPCAPQARPASGTDSSLAPCARQARPCVRYQSGKPRCPECGSMAGREAVDESTRGLTCLGAQGPLVAHVERTSGACRSQSARALGARSGPGPGARLDAALLIPGRQAVAHDHDLLLRHQRAPVSQRPRALRAAAHSSRWPACARPH